MQPQQRGQQGVEPGQAGDGRDAYPRSRRVSPNARDYYYRQLYEDDRYYHYPAQKGLDVPDVRKVDRLPGWVTGSGEEGAGSGVRAEEGGAERERWVDGIGASLVQMVREQRQGRGWQLQYLYSPEAMQRYQVVEAPKYGRSRRLSPPRA